MNELMGSSYISILSDRCDQLRKEKEELENINDKLSSALNSAEKRIDKAIKYIKENQKEYGSLLDNEKIILGILKGGNND
jgi:prefoldin subunit 5